MPEPSGPVPNNQLVITLVGEDRPGLLEKTARCIQDAGCNIEESRLAVLAGSCCMFLCVGGNWKTLGKLENMLPRLERETQLTAMLRKVPGETPAVPSMAYSVDVVALDQVGIVHALSGFFTARGVNVREMQTRLFRAQQTGARMFSANLIIDIPADRHLATLRGDFLDFCDDLNLDGMLDPIKG